MRRDRGPEENERKAVDLEGRLMEVARQRDNALNELAIRSGQLALAEKQIWKLNGDIKSLKERIDGGSDKHSEEPTAEPG